MAFVSCFSASHVVVARPEKKARNPEKKSIACAWCSAFEAARMRVYFASRLENNTGSMKAGNGFVDDSNV